MIKENHFQVFSDGTELSHSAALLFAQIARQAVTERERFTCALSGGDTPAGLFQLLAGAPYREMLPWAKMYFFWGDERCVPPDDPESNYHQALQIWLGNVPVPVENIQRVKGELGSFAAAEDYARVLKSFAEHGLDWPRFDLALMGLGTNGHTASLFPNSPQTSGIAVVPVSAAYQDRPIGRVSLTPDVFNAARNVVFLAIGTEKAWAVEATLNGKHDPGCMPAQRIQPTQGHLVWLLDAGAASRLDTRFPVSRPT